MSPDDITTAKMNARLFLLDHPEHSGEVKFVPDGVHMKHAALEAFRDWLIRRNPEIASHVDGEYRKSLRDGPVS